MAVSPSGIQATLDAIGNAGKAVGRTSRKVAGNGYARNIGLHALAGAVVGGALGGYPGDNVLGGAMKGALVGAAVGGGRLAYANREYLGKYANVMGRRTAFRARRAGNRMIGKAIMGARSYGEAGGAIGLINQGIGKAIMEARSPGGLGGTAMGMAIKGLRATRGNGAYIAGGAAMGAGLWAADRRMTPDQRKKTGLLAAAALVGMSAGAMI